MGGAPKPKRETSSERSARLAGAKRAGVDARAVTLDEEMIRKSKRRTSLFGGPETGMVSLGGGSSALGSY